MVNLGSISEQLLSEHTVPGPVGSRDSGEKEANNTLWDLATGWKTRHVRVNFLGEILCANVIDGN